MKEIRPWIINVYADDRCTDTYAAYASGAADDVEEIIGSNEELITTLVDSYIADWEDSFNEDDEDWMDMIAPHATEVTDEDLEDSSYVNWLNGLEIIYDERNVNE